MFSVDSGTLVSSISHGSKRTLNRPAGYAFGTSDFERGCDLTQYVLSVRRGSHRQIPMIKINKNSKSATIYFSR